jgi:sarcosine oxidase, subunit beta
MIPSPVTQNLDKTIVVIGGGVTGVLSAWELARTGARVILVEARALGSGASSRSAACIRAQFDTPATVRGMLYSINFFENWTEIMPGSQSPLKANGYLFLQNYLADVARLKERVAMQQACGLKEVEWLDAAALGEKFPHIDAVGLVGASWCGREGFLYPAIIYQDGADQAKKIGAEIVQNDPVVAAEVADGKGKAVILKSGRRIEADLFVNAANVWAPEISRFFRGTELAIQPERRYLYFLSGLSGDSDWGLDAEGFPGLPMTITPSGAYSRPENRQLMMGWLQFPCPMTATLDNQDEIESGFGLGFGEYGAAVRKEVTQFLPAAQDMGRIEAVTTGFYDVTPDHNPFFGFDPLVGNLIHACGFSGHGLMHSPFSGRIVAAMAAAGRNVDALDLPFGIGRAELGQYAIGRVFGSREGMVI